VFCVNGFICLRSFIFDYHIVIPAKAGIQCFKGRSRKVMKRKTSIEDLIRHGHSTLGRRACNLFSPDVILAYVEDDVENLPPREKAVLGESIKQFESHRKKCPYCRALVLEMQRAHLSAEIEDRGLFKVPETAPDENLLMQLDGERVRYAADSKPDAVCEVFGVAIPDNMPPGPSRQAGSVMLSVVAKRFKQQGFNVKLLGELEGINQGDYTLIESMLEGPLKSCGIDTKTIGTIYINIETRGNDGNGSTIKGNSYLLAAGVAAFSVILNQPLMEKPAFVGRLDWSGNFLGIDSLPDKLEFLERSGEVSRVYVSEHDLRTNRIDVEKFANVEIKAVRDLTECLINLFPQRFVLDGHSPEGLCDGVVSRKKTGAPWKKGTKTKKKLLGPIKKSVLLMTLAVLFAIGYLFFQTKHVKFVEDIPHQRFEEFRALSASRNNSDLKKAVSLGLNIRPDDPAFNRTFIETAKILLGPVTDVTAARKILSSYIAYADYIRNRKDAGGLIADTIDSAVDLLNEYSVMDADFKKAGIDVRIKEIMVRHGLKKGWGGLK
jgi:hypothetical protein